MSNVLWFLAGATLATIAVTRIKRANTESCCARVAAGGRDRLAGYAGPLAPVAGGLLDALGITPHIPGLLDTLGVPANA